MKKCVLIALLVGCAYATPARAAAIMSFDQVGTDVVGTLSGSLDLTGMTADALPSTFVGAGVEPNLAGFSIGTVGDPQTHYTQVTGPTSFGSGGYTGADNSSATDFAVYGGGPTTGLWVPVGYTSGNPLSGTLLFSNATFSSLGLTPGTYLYTLGSGDTVTVQIGPAAPVPEPASMLLLGSGFSAALLRRRRRKA